MALKIRLRAQGSTNRVVYRLVVADSRAPRDGKYIEGLGWYNPYANVEEQQIFVKPDRIQHWLSLGAEISDRVVSLVKKAAPQVIVALHAKKVAKTAKAAAKRKAQKLKNKA